MALELVNNLPYDHPYRWDGTLFGGQKLWRPDELGASLALWLDAEDTDSITLNGSNVSQWDDKSGNNRNHVQANAANQPPLISAAINGKPALQATTAGHFVEIADGNPTFGTTDLDAVAGDLHSVFCVMNGGDGTGFFQSTGGRAGLAYGKAGGIGSAATFVLGLLTHDGSDVALTPPRWFVGQKGWPSSGQSGAANNPTWHPGALNTNAVLGMVWDGTATTATVDGTPFANVGAPFTATNQNASARIGSTATTFGGPGTAGGGNAQVGELIICDTALSTDDRQKLEGYLAWKWGLEANLPGTHPYRYTPPTTDEPAWDADALSYIGRVQNADAQALELNVRIAINDFVKGCKADGVWDAIKASAILAGARTLDGALQPLVGSAPTNFSFVPGDYDRKTGLVGDGSTKYLDSNHNNNADPQNNHHVSAYVDTAATTSGFSVLIGTETSAPTTLGINTTFVESAARSRNSSPATRPGADTALGLHASTRVASSEFTYRVTQSNTTHSVASIAPGADPYFVFRRNGGSASYTNARIAFYSIGEALDLAQLDARVTTLINAYGAI